MYFKYISTERTEGQDKHINGRILNSILKLIVKL